MKTWEDVFEGRYRVVGECWEWTGNRDPKGCGRINMNHGGVLRVWFTHRISAALSGLEITDRHVCHHCDNPPCIRPEHLFVGTHLLNMRDMREKGRFAYGSRQSSAKLTDADVRMISASDKSQTSLAARLGVTQSNISHIRARRSWKHLP